MRAKCVLFLFFIFNAVVSAQVPDKLSYQATVRNADNSILENVRIAMKIAILQNSLSGNSVYEEVHSPTTSSNGLVGIEIGGGTAIRGDFSAINWSEGPYFIETSVDIKGGSSYKLQAASQLLSVPYALHAKNADGLTNNGGYVMKAKAIPFESSRIVNEGDVGNTIACTQNATLTLIENFAEMEIGDIINLETHNGATLTVDTAPQVTLNYTKNNSAFFESTIGNVRFGILRKLSDNAYIISGQ